MSSLLENLRSQHSDGAVPKADIQMGFNSLSEYQMNNNISNCQDAVMESWNNFCDGVGIVNIDMESNHTQFPSDPELEGALTKVKELGKTVVKKIIAFIDAVISKITKYIDALKSALDERFVHEHSNDIVVAASLEGSVQMSANWDFESKFNVGEELDKDMTSSKAIVDKAIAVMEKGGMKKERLGAEGKHTSRFLATHDQALIHDLTKSLLGHVDEKIAISEITNLYLSRKMLKKELKESFYTSTKVNFKDFCNGIGMAYFTTSTSTRRVLKDLQKMLREDKKVLSAISFGDNDSQYTKKCLTVVKDLYNTELSIANTAVGAVMARRKDLLKGFKAAIKMARSAKKQSK